MICGRSQTSFDTIKEILDYYKEKKPGFKLKVGTVLTRLNMSHDHFENMYKFLLQYPITKWKIFELIPEQSGIKAHKKVGYSTSDFLAFQEKVLKIQDGIDEIASFNIDFSRRNSRDGAYFIIRPDGKTFIPLDDGQKVNEFLLGDMLVDSLQSIVELWKTKRHVMNCIANFEKRRVSKSFHADLDEIYRKILFLLDNDPLQIDGKISSKLNLPEQQIVQRINRLYDIRAIVSVIPIIDVSKFGFDVYLVNLHFKKEIENKIDYIASVLCYNKNIAWVAECYDWLAENSDIIFRVAIFAQNVHELLSVINKLKNIFGETMFNYQFDFVPNKYIYGQRYVLEEGNEQIAEKFEKSHIVLNKKERYKIKQNEYIFFSQSKSAKRFTINDIAKSMRVRESKVSRIIQGLRSKKIINKFQAIYDPAILGYTWYKFFIKFKNSNDIIQFESLIKNFKHITHINALNGSKWDMDFEIHVKNPIEGFNFWDEIKASFKGKIVDEKVIKIKKEYKFDFLIPSVLEAMRNQVD